MIGGSKPRFDVGDVVKLTSGGPDMTIQEQLGYSSSNDYRAQWFAGKKLESGFFPAQSLELVRKKGDKCEPE